MRLPGTERAGLWCVRTFALTDSDIAGCKRAWGITKLWATGVATDLMVTGGDLLTLLKENPQAALGMYVVPAVTAALGKARREYRTRDPSDSYPDPEPVKEEPHGDPERV